MTTPNLPIGEAVNYPDPIEGGPSKHRRAAVKKQISRGGYGRIGLKVVDENGELTGVDSISIKLFKSGDPVEVELEVESSISGEYSCLLGPNVTTLSGELEALWEYRVGEYSLSFSQVLSIQDSMPLYDSLTESEKGVVEQVSWLFGDLFDSTEGGAFLTETFQSHFNYERLSQLTVRALQKINTFSQPLTHYFVGTSGRGTSRMPAKYHGLLVSMTYLEVLRHLMRSYVEQPEFRNMSTTYTDRRDYLNRWKTILDEEKPAVEDAITLMKRELMNLGRGALLVSGGIYGGSGRNGYFMPGAYTSAVRGTRFYPAIPLLNAYPR